MSEKISIIIPVYKVEDYLETCIDSILAQTYKNLEIILVDDGSPDSCGSICDRYARVDARIRVIHKENAGVETMVWTLPLEITSVLSTVTTGSRRIPMNVCIGN